jgi:hypothetical protein
VINTFLRLHQQRQAQQRERELLEQQQQQHEDAGGTASSSDESSAAGSECDAEQQQQQAELAMPQLTMSGATKLADRLLSVLDESQQQMLQQQQVVPQQQQQQQQPEACGADLGVSPSDVQLQCDTAAASPTAAAAAAEREEGDAAAGALKQSPSDWLARVSAKQQQQEGQHQRERLPPEQLQQLHARGLAM